MAARRADMFIDPDIDPRADPPVRSDERETLAGFLRWQRETLELKCRGIDAPGLARRCLDPSTMSLLGLVRHMADVERMWFRRVLAGRDAPPRFYSGADPDGDFDGAVPDPAVVAQAFRAWRAEIAFAEQLVAGAPDLDVTGNEPWFGEVSLRWVLVHMVEEYARHNGHADLLRERLDGAVGQLGRVSEVGPVVAWRRRHQHSSLRVDGSLRTRQDALGQLIELTGEVNRELLGSGR